MTTIKDYLVTPNAAQTLTNKGIDADTNLIRNLEVGNIKNSSVSKSIPSSGAVDTKLTTEKAVKDSLDKKATVFYGDSEPTGAVEGDYWASEGAGNFTGSDIKVSPTDTDTIDVALGKKQNANLVSAFQAVPDDTHYPSEKLVKNSLDTKVDKVTGKQLSTEDYTAADKAIVNGVTAALAGKVDKVTGKQLSTEDYTSNEKTKLAGIAEGAEVNVQSDWNQTDSAADDFIKNKPSSMEPTAHAASHGSGGTDELTVAQAQVTGLADALNAKVPTSRTVNGHALSSNVTVTKSDVGLGNCDNTSDANKPVSTAVNNLVGALANLSTTDKTNIVAAINELVASIATKAPSTALTDGSVTKVGTATVGGTLKPMYLSSGTPTAGTQLYSKNININGTNQAVIRSSNADVGTIYAPTTAGTAGQVVKSNGSKAPSWGDAINVTELWSGEMTSGTNDLSDAYTNYKFLVIKAKDITNGSFFYGMCLFPSTHTTIATNVVVTSDLAWITYYFPSTTKITVPNHCTSPNTGIFAVYGVK